MANSHSLQKDLVAHSRATTWSNSGGRRIRPTAAGSECLFQFSEIHFPGIARSAVGIRCKCISSYILMLYTASRWGWCLNNPGSGDPSGRQSEPLALLFFTVSWRGQAGPGQAIFWEMIHIPPLTQPGWRWWSQPPCPFPPSLVCSIHLLKRLGTCNHMQIKTHARFKTRSENHHKTMC